MRLASTQLRLWLLAGGAAALLAAQPAAAAVALNGEMNAVANAKADGGATVTDTDHAAWSGAPSTLNTSVQAQATAGVYHDHNERVTSYGDAQGTWAGANSGSVTFTNYGWDLNTISPLAGDEADIDVGRPGNGADWSYTFQATGDGVFTMNYDVVGSGDTFGLFGWAIFFTGCGCGAPDLNTLGNDPTTSGVFSSAISAGQTYTAYLFGNPNIAHSSSIHEIGSMDGQFDWTISERPAVDGGAPEPAAWALMLGGFGLAGGMLRRRRKAIQAL